MVFHIADDHFAETFRIFVLRTTQKNDFIAQNGSGILLDIVFRDVVGRIGLEARDKIHTGEIPFIQHGKIDVSAITNHHAVTREFHSSGAVYLMNISIGEINEHGKMTIMIQQHIELDCRKAQSALRRDCKVSWETKTHAVAQLHGSVPEAYGKYRRTFSESDGHWRTTSWIWLERIPLQDDSTCLRRFSNLRKSLADYWPAPTGRRSSTQNVPNCQRTVFACLHCVS